MTTEKFLDPMSLELSRSLTLSWSSIYLTPGVVEAASKHCHAGEQGLASRLCWRHTRGIVPEWAAHHLQLRGCRLH